MKEWQPVGLGDRAKDPVSGFSGIVTSVTTFLHGCIRVAITPEKLDKDGKPRDEKYFDQSQIMLVRAQVHAPMVLSVGEPPQPEKRRSNGGPAREGVGFRR